MESSNWTSETDKDEVEIILNPETQKMIPEMEKPENIYIEDILEINPETLSSCKAIKYECFLSSFIIAIINNSSNKDEKYSYKNTQSLSLNTIKDIITYLKWISRCSEVLAKRIGQTLIENNFPKDSVPHLIRSSYTFCNRYIQCKDFYNKFEEPTCHRHHYVHSLLKNNTDSIIYFLEYYLEKSKEQNSKDQVPEQEGHLLISNDDAYNFFLSIKTLIYVTKHMEKEISCIEFMTNNNSEKFHRNNPFMARRAYQDNYGYENNRPKSFVHTNEIFHDNSHMDHPGTNGDIPPQEENGQSYSTDVCENTEISLSEISLLDENENECIVPKKGLKNEPSTFKQKNNHSNPRNKKKNRPPPKPKLNNKYEDNNIYSLLDKEFI
jgi:hypothetical protein